MCSKVVWKAVRERFGGVFVPGDGLKGHAGTFRGRFCARTAFRATPENDFRERFYVVLGEVVGYFGRGAIK